MQASSATSSPTAAEASSSASARGRKREGEDDGDGHHGHGVTGDVNCDVNVAGRDGVAPPDGDGDPTTTETAAVTVTVGDMVKAFTDSRLPPAPGCSGTSTTAGAAPSSTTGAVGGSNKYHPNQSSDQEHGTAVTVVHPFSKWEEPLISSTSVVPPENVVNVANNNEASKKNGDAASSSATAAAATAGGAASGQTQSATGSRGGAHAVATMEDFRLAHRNDLTLFEVHRRPREVIPLPDDDEEARVGVPLKVLNAEFCCPVCLGYMKKTSIVMECLHRFCGECIQKCLRLGVKKECPSCRIHIPSRRSLRPDPNFDMLIAGIYGDIRALEDREEREIESLNKARNMNNAYAESRRRGILQQAMYRKRKGPVRSSDSEVAAGSKRRASSQNAMESPLAARPTLTSPPLEQVEESSPLIDFVLRRHPQETFVDRLDKEYLSTNRRVTVQLLKTFLSRKLSYKPLTDIKILIVVDGDTIILDDSITLDDVERSLSEQPDGFGKHLIFHYAVHNSIGEDS